MNADDNLATWQLLFSTYPAAEAAWQQKRLDYIDSIAHSEWKGDLTVAGLRAQRALNFLPATDPKVCLLSPRASLSPRQAQMQTGNGSVLVTC